MMSNQEILGMDSANAAAKEMPYGSNMTISAALVIEMVKRIVELEKALNKLIDRAQQVDSWESFPESWIDEAYEALKEPKT
jgi:hypothetical protein